MLMQALGDIDDRVRWIATQLGFTAILWNLDTDDWAAGTQPGVTEQTVNQNYENFITMGKNGTFANSGNIVLSHEINNMTMDFALKHFPEIKNAYKHITDVATCMNITQPYIEDSLTFPTFEQYINNSTSPSGKSLSSANVHVPVAYQTSGILFAIVLFFTFLGQSFFPHTYLTSPYPSILFAYAH